jgi:hypothetical protein
MNKIEANLQGHEGGHPFAIESDELRELLTNYIAVVCRIYERTSHLTELDHPDRI